MRECVDEGILQSYFDGELSNVQMESVASHLVSCTGCAAAARELNIARAEIERANYTSQFNPYLDSLGDYRMRASNSSGRLTICL